MFNNNEDPKNKIEQQDDLIEELENRVAKLEEILDVQVEEDEIEDIEDDEDNEDEE